MPNRSVIRRRRAVLAVFVGLSIVLLTAYFGESGGGALHAIQRGAQEALAPIESGASRVVKPLRDLVGWTGDVLDAKGDNRKLESEVARLRRELAQAQTARRDAAELRRLVGIDEEGEWSEFSPASERVTARVIARSPTVWYSAVQIDKGREDGVRVDQPVISGDGLVGRVASVTGGAARVTLITDASSAVSAQVFPDGATGVVKSNVGDPNDLLLDFIQKGRDVTKGANVMSSGFRSSRLGSLFPRGIPIGKVTRVEPQELESYLRVHIEPYARLRDVDVVQVLVPAPAGERAEVVTP